MPISMTASFRMIQAADLPCISGDSERNKTGNILSEIQYCLSIRRVQHLRLKRLVCTDDLPLGGHQLSVVCTGNTGLPGTVIEAGFGPSGRSVSQMETRFLQDYLSSPGGSDDCRREKEEQYDDPFLHQ